MQDADRFADSRADFAWSLPTSWLIVRGDTVSFNTPPMSLSS
jgi:hypothetical protein